MPLIRFTCQNCTPGQLFEDCKASKLYPKENNDFIEKGKINGKSHLSVHPGCRLWRPNFFDISNLYHHLTVKLYIENIHVLVRTPLPVFDELT